MWSREQLKSGQQVISKGDVRRMHDCLDMGQFIVTNCHHLLLVPSGPGRVWGHALPEFLFINLIEYGISFCILKYKSVYL